MYESVVLAKSGGAVCDPGLYRCNPAGYANNGLLILAAWAASKGWPQMDDWLLNHPKYGPTLRDWRAHGTVPRKAKWLASIMMLISGIIMLFTTAPLAVKAFTNITMLIVAIWLWRRPEPNQILIQQNTVDPEKDRSTNSAI